MSTTEQVAEIPAVEPLPVVTRFASRGRHLALERKIPNRVVDAGGGVHWTSGITYEFEDGNLLIYPEQDRLADKFNADTGELEEQDALEWLRAHDLYGTDRGFWEVAPITPDPASLLRTVMQLAVAAGNPETRAEAEEKLVAIHEQEAQSWCRQVVLTAVTTALTVIESQAKVSEVTSGPAPSGTVTRDMPYGPPPKPVVTEEGVAGAPHSEFKPSLTRSGFNPESAPPKEQ